MSESIIRIIVMISGSGTNLQALIDAVKSNTLPNASIVKVISNRKAACKMPTLSYKSCLLLTGVRWSCAGPKRRHPNLLP